MLILYVCMPEKFTAEYLKEVVGDNPTLIATIFIVASCIRAIFFLPSTLFVVIGIALYPDNPWFVLSISLLGILIGASIVYKLAQTTAPDQLFGEKQVKRMAKIERQMKNRGALIVFFWSFFPIVPTDLICYVAGVTRMNFWKFILAIFAGETILVAIYIWTGRSLIGLLF